MFQNDLGGIVRTDEATVEREFKIVRLAATKGRARRAPATLKHAATD